MLRLFVLVILFYAQISFAEKLPRESVIDVPAIGDGLCVHNIYQSNMVLQRNKPVTIRGWAAPGEKVTVNFAGKELVATAEKDRSWKVEFPAMEANSTPQKLSVKGQSKSIELENILIGDVWVLGGQSNMEFPVFKVQDGDLEVLSANFREIRIMTVPAQNGAEMQKSFPSLMEWSDWSKRHFRKGYWDVCNAESVGELSAIGFVFARRLHMVSGVPIGVIDASRGGTTVESWTPDPVLRSIDTVEVKELLAEWDQKVAEYNPEEDLKKRIANHKNWVERMKKQGKPANREEPKDLQPGPAMNQNRPGNNFASMISPLEGLPVKGTIFHQGFNNAFNGSVGAEMYYQVFSKMITAWRKNFNDPQMPFGIISLCTAGDPQTLDNFSEKMMDIGVYLRHAQFQTYLDFVKAGDKNIGFASSFDMRRSWYHPQLKFPVGDRIARWALATQYGQKINWKPPVCTGFESKDGKLVLKMDNRLRVDDSGPIQGFAIAGKDGKFYPADADWLVNGKSKDTSVIILSSPMVNEPVHYRYAWSRNPMGNVYVGEQINVPMATQRSDSWQQKDIAKLMLPGEEISRKLERSQTGKMKNALKELDLLRRLDAAKRLIEENQKLLNSVK